MDAHAESDPHPESKPPAGRALVVGASSGIGAALVRALALEGYAVAAVARRKELLDELARACQGRVAAVAHDVARFEEAPRVFEGTVRELGGLDLFVYAAGIMPEIGANEYDTAKDLDILAVNLGGCIAWTNEAARYFRAQRAGTIVGISSVAGERGRKGNPVYGASKAAMNHYLEALRNRLAEARVHVCTIKPGFVETAMVQAARARGRTVKGAISADACARAILSAARARANERFVPRKWGPIMLAIRSIPSAIFRHLNV
jgi:short-subunit dehydrogenase